MTTTKNSIKIYSNLVLLIIISLFVSCNESKSSLEIKDASIKIKPYNKGDHGKFWNICIDYNNVGYSDKPVAYFEIHAKEDIIREYNIDFIHFDQKCNKKNVLVYFTHKHTPHEEWKWLKSLDPDEIEFVKLRACSGITGIKN